MLHWRRRRKLARGLDDLKDASFAYQSLTGDIANSGENIISAAKAGAAGMATSEQAVRFAQKAIAAYNLDQSEFNRILGVGLTIQKEADTTLGALGSNMGRLYGISAAMNISFEETTAAVGALTLGLGSTEEAAQAYEGIVGSLLTPNDALAFAIQTVAEQTESLGDISGKSFDELAPLILQTEGLSYLLTELSEQGNIAELFPEETAIRGMIGLAGELNDEFNEMVVAAEAVDDTTLDETFQRGRQRIRQVI